MKVDPVVERYHKLRNGVLALIFWNIIFLDIAIVYTALNGGLNGG